MSRQKKSSSTPLIRIILFTVIMLISALPAYATFSDCAIDWNKFTTNPGYTADYTYKGLPIRDTESNGMGGDTSKGATPTGAMDLASAAATTNPGPQTTPFFGYYDGGTPYDPNNPSTMNDDVIFFRMRVGGDPSASGGGRNDFSGGNWNILFDVDGDGYKEYWIDLDGNCPGTTGAVVCGNSGQYDRLLIMYNNDSTQLMPDPDNNPSIITAYYEAQVTPARGTCPLGSPGVSHTRSYPVGDGSGDYYIDIQVPMIAFKDINGNQVLFPDSPVAFVFSTSNSNTDPLQKDYMMDINYITDVDPITFGDAIIPDGTPQIYFTDSAFNSADFYTVGNSVYVSVTDRMANTNSSTIQTITVTVTNPTTGDDQQITLTETGPNTGIFHSSALPTVASDGIFNNTDGNGSLEVAPGNTLYVTYTNSKSYTVTDQAAIIGTTCDAFMEFTRASGLPSTAFELNSNPSLSDKLYLTIYNNNANTNPATQQQITSVTLTGVTGDSLSLSPTIYPLIETGNNTGIFRNTTGITTQGAYPPITTNTTWEDVDGGIVTATYTYTCGGNSYTKSTTAQLFYTAAAGRVNFTNQAGTSNVSLYTANQPVYMKVQDANACTTQVGGINTVTVTVTSSVGDSESVRLYETFPGSYVFMNSSTPITTALYSGSYTVNNGVISAQNGDTLTVGYADCNDGDADPSNNNKTDTALFNTPPLLINEVLFYPDNTTAGQGEYIQIYNSSTQSVTATGYRVTDGDAINYTVPQLNGSNIVLTPGQKLYLMIYPTGSAPSDYFDSATGTYYLFVEVGPSFPTDQLGDPAAVNSADRADQISLYNSSGTIVDYVAWSATLSPSVDFMSDFSSAVAQGIWQDGAFKDVTGIQPGYSIYRCQGGVARDGYDTNQPSDWCVSLTPSTVYQSVITYVSLSSFSAHELDGQVVVQWETTSEHNTLGFYLLRFDPATGKYQSVTEGLLPGMLTSPVGGTYSLVDRSASPGGTYKYKLIEVEKNGHRITYGPFSAVVGGGNAISSQALKSDAARSAARANSSSSSDYTREPRGMSASEKARLQSRDSFERSVKAPNVKQTAGRIKIPVTDNGIYFVDANDIASNLGVTSAKASDMIKNNQLSMSNQGRPVAYLPEQNNKGIFFYGAGTDNVYTRDNIYWIDKSKGVRMAPETGPKPGAVKGFETFSDTLHLEQDLIPNLGQFSDPEADLWAWEGIYLSPAYSDLPKELSFEVNGKADIEETATLQLHLLGGSDAGTGHDHHVVVKLNDQKIGEGLWSGLAPYTLHASFPQSLIAGGNNTLEVSGVLDAGVPWSYTLIDSFDLKYERTYTAAGDELVFSGDGNRTVTVTGFTSPDIFVFDITNRQMPKLNTSATVTGTPGNWQVSLNPVSPVALYMSVAAGAVTKVVNARAVNPSNLQAKNNAADYVVIAPSELIAAAQPLADYRTSRGLKTMVIRVDDIMNEFNFGLSSPNAIRKFLAYAYSNWKKAPRYVVLAGEGTWDYRDNWGFGWNMVPPALVPSLYGLATSDNSLADIHRDHLPEMAIGRLPALTPKELQNAIDNIKTFEKTRGNRVIVLADSPDGEGDFTAESETLAALFPNNYIKERIYLSELSTDTARTMLFTDLNKGAVFFNYIGHASPFQLSGEGLLTTDDLPLLANGGGLPVVTAMTCSAGEFAIPGYSTLGSLLVLKEKGGAAAVWSSTGLSDDFEANILNREFYKAIFKSGKKTLGEAVKQALSRYKWTGTMPFMTDLYGIIGDPALTIR